MYGTYMYCQVVHATSVPLYMYNLQYYMYMYIMYNSMVHVMWWYFSQIVGVTTAVPDEVPEYLPTHDASNNEWYYCGNTQALFHNHSHTRYSHLSRLDDFEVVGLLLLPNGELYLFSDGKNSAKIATGLPVHKSLFGAVEVRSRCTKIKSEMLSGELDGVCLWVVTSFKKSRNMMCQHFYVYYMSPLVSTSLYSSLP